MSRGGRWGRDDRWAVPPLLASPPTHPAALSPPRHRGPPPPPPPPPRLLPPPPPRHPSLQHLIEVLAKARITDARMMEFFPQQVEVGVKEVGSAVEE